MKEVQRCKLCGAINAPGILLAMHQYRGTCLNCGDIICSPELLASYRGDMKNENGENFHLFVPERYIIKCPTCQNQVVNIAISCFDMQIKNMRSIIFGSWAVKAGKMEEN